MKQAIFITGQKGGSGKTTLARAILDALRQQGQSCAAFDADGQVGQLLQYYGSRDKQGRLEPQQNPLTGVGYFDIRDPKQRDGVVEALDTEAETILVDLPGGSLDELSKVLGTPEALFVEYRQAGYEVTLATVITPMLASARTVLEMLNMFGDSVSRYLVVKNLAFADADEFVIFDGLNENGEQKFGKGKSALLAKGGLVIELPKLASRTYALLDLYNLSFTSALSDTRLTRTDRTRVKHWLHAVEANLAPILSVSSKGAGK